MKKAIAILSVLLLLMPGSAMAARAGRDGVERGMMDYGEGYDCSSITTNTKLKLTAEQAVQLLALNEKYAQEIQPIREQLRNKGHELKLEWLQTEPDRGRIEVVRGEAVKLHERLRAKLAAHRADLLKILTLEQQAQLPDGGPGRHFTKPAGFGRR
jgi:Spy/CpxP family protein refolding chaperone